MTLRDTVLAVRADLNACLLERETAVSSMGAQAGM